MLIFYHMLSDGDFSFILTLSGVVRFSGFAMLVFHLFKARTAAGVSAKSLALFATAFLCRALTLFSFQGYLPLDRSGDFVPHIELLSFLAACVALFVTLHLHRATYAREEDSFGKNAIPGVPHEAGPLLLLVPALLLALVLHPSLNNDFASDTAWTFALFLEAVSPIPQLVMLTTSKKPVERFMSHYIFCLSLARIFSLLFWISSFHELNNSKTFTGRWVGPLVLLNEVVAVFVLGDYTYYYLRALRSNEALTLGV